MSDTTPLETTPASAPETPRRRGVLRPILIGVGSGVAILALGLGGFALADELNDSDDDRLVITSSERSDASDDDATSTLQPVPSGQPYLGPDAAISDEEYARVSAAALEAVGGGEVTELTRDDDPGVAWEVEIRLANGDEADVELAEDLSVVRIDLDQKG